jgi:peptidoglycan/LPS O-acetylase OafA/YrhL
MGSSERKYDLSGGMLLLGISFWVCDDQASERASLFGFTIVAVSYGMIVMSAVSKSSFLYQSKSYITSQLAALSYAVYLSHKGIIHMTQAVLERFDIQASGHISLVLCLLACITGGILYRLLLEIPFSRIKFRILKRELGRENLSYRLAEFFRGHFGGPSPFKSLNKKIDGQKYNADDDTDRPQNFLFYRYF